MNRFLSTSLVCSLVVCALSSPCAAQTNDVEQEKEQGITYIIPVKGLIDPGLLVYVIRNGVDKALKADAGAIIFDMDTPGGFVVVAEEIVRLLMDIPDDVRTYTFVNKDALSAGAFLAVATDEIYMAPGSRIGASAIITLTGKPLEGDVREKALSSLLALVKRAAKVKGHDVKLVEAMVRSESEYKIGDEVLCEKGQLLTLSDLDATRLVGEGDNKRPLLAKGTAKDLDELMVKIGRANTKRLTLTISWSENIAKWIQTLRILFLIGGLLGLYMEFKTPGFGIPGMMGVVFLVIFFWGHHVAGLAGMEEMLLFVLGIALLLVEIFLIPGFGFIGVGGIACMVTALLLAMVQHYPGTPRFKIPALHMQNALITMGAALGGAGVLALLVARFLPETSIFRHVALAATTSHEEGYNVSADMSGLLGSRGVALTPLHPSGTGMFDEERVSVVARGNFIDADTPIVVAEVHGNRIVVDKA